MITPEIKTKALSVWAYLKRHPDMSADKLAQNCGLTPDNITKLVLLQTMDARDGFMEAYNLMVGGT